MIVVTGGAGFIGSGIIWALNLRGMTDILVVDEADDSQGIKNLTGLSYTDYMEKGEYLEAVLGRKLGQDPEAIIHMGACSSTTETNSTYLNSNNFEYTKHLAEYSVEQSIRFIYASSAATYGDGSAGYSDTIAKLPNLTPLNLYGLSKHNFDLWAAQNNLFNKVVGLKYFNVFGPNEYHKGDMRSLVCKGYAEILKTGKLRLFKSHRREYADGEQVRDFIYIKDVVQMTLFFLDNPELNGLFNIGTGSASSWNSLGDALFSAMGLRTNIEFIEMPISIRDKYQYHTEAEMGRLHRAGYDRPQTSLADSVRDYVQNYLKDGKYLSV